MIFMNKYITYKRINYILTEITKIPYKINKKEKLDENILEIEIKELFDNFFIEFVDKEIIWWNNFDLINFKITQEWKKFLNSYKWCRKIEYFFRDFPFFATILIWAIGWILWWIVLEIIKCIK